MCRLTRTLVSGKLYLVSIAAAGRCLPFGGESYEGGGARFPGKRLSRDSRQSCPTRDRSITRRVRLA